MKLLEEPRSLFVESSDRLLKQLAIVSGAFARTSGDDLRSPPKSALLERTGEARRKRTLTSPSSVERTCSISLPSSSSCCSSLLLGDFSSFHLRDFSPRTSFPFSLLGET